MAWTEDIYPHFQPYDPQACQILPAPQQSTTIPQQLPAPMMPPGSAPSIRPSGHVKDGLVELMTIQNAQMHQVIMSNTTMSALRSFGYSGPQSGPEVCQHQAPTDLVIIQENETDPEIFHHYYQPAFLYFSYLTWHPNKPTSAPSLRDRPAVPPPLLPPPPPSATTGRAGAEVAPAAVYNRAAEGR